MVKEGLVVCTKSENSSLTETYMTGKKKEHTKSKAEETAHAICSGIRGKTSMFGASSASWRLVQDEARKVGGTRWAMAGVWILLRIQCY